MTTTPFHDPNVKTAFNAFPDDLRPTLLRLREMIFDTAARTPDVGALEETLKWGQPAYLTPQTKSGSTLRLGMPKTGGVALYAHCQTTIISDFASQFAQDFAIEGNRAVHLPADSDLAEAPLRQLIHSALTYHLK
ncbi:MAG: DUF1801 domain-containing protein [Alphaproteobacteria bacterium]|uniref:DUF1801 domain-containing protein n=1 Tax=Shimia sp. TaxID=1954381 RepID=UPI00329A5277